LQKSKVHQAQKWDWVFEIQIHYFIRTLQKRTKAQPIYLGREENPHWDKEMGLGPLVGTKQVEIAKP